MREWAERVLNRHNTNLYVSFWQMSSPNSGKRLTMGVHTPSCCRLFFTWAYSDRVISMALHSYKGIAKQWRSTWDFVISKLAPFTTRGAMSSRLTVWRLVWREILLCVDSHANVQKYYCIRPVIYCELCTKIN